MERVNGAALKRTSRVFVVLPVYNKKHTSTLTLNSIMYKYTQNIHCSMTLEIDLLLIRKSGPRGTTGSIYFLGIASSNQCEMLTFSPYDICLIFFIDNFSKKNYNFKMIPKFSSLTLTRILIKAQ
jgi:hypothetical protein